MRNRILLADGDSGLMSIRSLRLRIEGYEVMELADCAAAMRAMDEFQPHILLLDPAMSGGETLLQWVRSQHRHDAVKIVVNSSRNYDAGHRFCGNLSADACLAKPLEHDQLLRVARKLLRDEIAVTFWGTRGTLARPGIETLKYGGNTPCVSVELSKDRYFIFDAGTGIADFGRLLAQAPRRYRFNLFLTHARWEHVQGLPFFQPLRNEGNGMVVHGPRKGRLSLRESLEAHAGHVCRPVVVDEYGTRLRFRELEQGEYRIDGLRVYTIELNRPGGALGYRLEGESGQVVVYLAENEIAPGDRKARDRFAAFAAGADVLIHGAGYFDHEYRYRNGRGGSPLSEVVRLAAYARVKSLYLFHHDPEHDDEAVTSMQELARGYFQDLGAAVRCVAAAEGETVTLDVPEFAAALQPADRAPQISRLAL